MERLRAMEMSLKSLETSLASSVEGMTAKLDMLLSFGHAEVPSRAEEPHEVEKVRKLDTIDQKINMIAEAVGVRLRAKQEEDAEDRKRLKERLKEALMHEKRTLVDADDRESWAEYIFGITKPNGRVGKTGSRCAHARCCGAGERRC
jgi:hypothetical protein